MRDDGAISDEERRATRAGTNREHYGTGVHMVNEASAYAVSGSPRRSAPQVIAMVGLPRSGKSVWASMQGFPMVCPDAIRHELHGQRFEAKAEAKAEPMVWAIAKLMVGALLLAGHRTVILDACNNTRKRREEWSKDFHTEFVVIDTPAETCLKRAIDEDDRHIIPIIGKMAAEFEPLGDDEPRYGGACVGPGA